MAKVKAPLLSFSASGKIADTLVAFSWKGINVMRQYVVPSNPQTDDQIAQRAHVTQCVIAWKNYFVTAGGRAAWNRLALEYSTAMSGFNAYMRNTLKMRLTDEAASFASLMQAAAVNTVQTSMFNLDDGAGGDEAGNFEIWAGSTVSNMILDEEVAIAAGHVTGTNDLGDAGDIVYAKIRKDNYDRSGIYKITLID